MMDITQIRSQFPALTLKSLGRDTIFFDNAAGTQIAQPAISRINDYFLTANANTGGLFETSRRSDELIETTRSAVADFIGAEDAEEIAFGANMTTLTQAFARAFGRSCQPGDEIVTTRLEHEANVSPWLGLQEQGVVVRFADINPADATIDLASLKEQLSLRTRLVAVGYASNAFGTVNPVATIAKMAHKVGALCFVDAVHYSPHGAIDVASLGCDILVYSAYKAFGTHVGILWGKREVLERIETFHLRTVKNVIPDKFEVGTQNHEGIAGVLGALDYLDSLSPLNHATANRRTRLHGVMSTIRDYEQTLSAKLLEVFEKHPHVQVYGITDRDRLAERVPTFAIRIKGLAPHEVATHLAEASINVWAGNYYALEPMTRLGLEDSGGAVRISLVHYNTLAEIERLDEVLAELASR